MMYMDRRRAFGWWLVLAATAYFALYLNGVSYMLFDTEGDALMMFEFAGGMGFVSPIMPLIAALPFATGFCQDWSAGYTGAVAIRSGKARYLRSKAVACALSGGLAVALGMLMFVLLLNLKFPQDFAEGSMLEGASDLGALLLGGDLKSFTLYYAARLLLQFLAGAFWATTALTFSAFYPNVPLTLCAPLVLYRLAAEVGSLAGVPAFLNLTWLDDGQIGLSPVATLASGVLVFSALSILLALVFSWRAGRRLSYA